jgi:hypothetical protein
VIGLSRSFVTTDGQNSNSAFLDSLYQSDQIENKLFSVHFDSASTSQIEFGSYNSSLIYGSAPFTFLQTPYAKRWTVNINAFKVTDQPLFANGAKNAFYLDGSKVAVLDTFSPYIKLPKASAVQIFAKILHGIDFVTIDGLLLGPCDRSQYHNVSLFVNDQYYFKITPDAYVVDVGREDKCFVNLDSNDKDEWLLGEPFFRSFYTVFDDTQGVVGFAPSVLSPGSSIYEGELPEDPLRRPAQE